MALSDDELDRRLEVASEVMREAAGLALRHFRNRVALEIERKGLQDVVSLADRAVEDLIRARLGAAFPGDAVLGEERGLDERGGALAERLWIVDPIDGTANYLRGMPYWSVTLAFVADGEPTLALTADPVHDELFTARRGRGTQRNGEPVRVSGITDTAQACIGLSYSFKTSKDDYVRLVQGLLVQDLDHRRMGSAALSLGHVADGRLDAVVALHTNAWDVLPGLLLVTEAGGLATRYTDGCSLLAPRAVAACTPRLAAAIEQASGIGLR